jgi:hypothetical protein
MDTHFVYKSILEFERGDYISGMHFICPPIDATAKKRYTGKKYGVGKRVRLFLNDEINNLMALTIKKHTVTFKCGGTIIINGKSLEDIIYKLVRNGLAHNAQWPQEIELVDNIVFGSAPKITLPKEFLRCLPLIVIGSKENSNCRFKNQCILRINGKSLDINNYWGRIQNVIELVKDNYN